MNKTLEFIHSTAPVVTAALVAFTGGLLIADLTQQPPKDVYLDAKTVTIRYDTPRLTPTTCMTGEECRIAQAIVFYNEHQLPLPPTNVLEPVDCSDLKGIERTACEKVNNTNAGKPVLDTGTEQQ